MLRDEYADNAKRFRGFSPSFVREVQERRNAERAAALVESERQEALRIMRRNGVPESVRAIVFEVTAAHGATAYQMMTKARSRNVTEARAEIFYRCKQDRPERSFPMIGKWFGTDHTTVMHGVARHAMRAGLPQLSGYDIERVMETNRIRVAKRARLKRAAA